MTTRRRALRICGPIPGLGLFPGEVLVYQPGAPNPADKFMAVRCVQMTVASFTALADSPLVEVLPGDGPDCVPILRLEPGGKK